MVIGTPVAMRRRQGASLPWVARRLRVPSPDPAADALLRAAPREQQIEEVMRTLTFLLRNDLKLQELDTLRLALDEGLEDPLEIKAWAIKGISGGQKSTVVRDLRSRLAVKLQALRDGTPAPAH